MEKSYSVAIHYGDALGYVEFDQDSHRAKVTLPDDEGRRLTEEYLASRHGINLPAGDGLTDFGVREIDPLADVTSFQLAMTRIWEATGVYVDWSRPVWFVKRYPTLASLPKGGVPGSAPEDE